MPPIFLHDSTPRIYYHRESDSSILHFYQSYANVFFLLKTLHDLYSRLLKLLVMLRNNRVKMQGLHLLILTIQK